MINYVREVFNNIYYKIVSFENIFSLCLYCERAEKCEIYYLAGNHFSDEQEREIEDEIREKNTDCDGINIIPYTGEVTFFDLMEMQSNIRLAAIFGFEPDDFPWKYSLIRDVDEGFEPKETHPYLMGFNSLNYDMTMLALYFTEVFRIRNEDSMKAVFVPTMSETMRRYHDELISSHFRNNMPNRLRYVYTYEPKEQKLPSTYRIKGRYLKKENIEIHNQAYYVRLNQLNSGRHIDMARLNEKAGNMELKKLLGMLGYQITEPDIFFLPKENIRNNTFDEMKSLFAHNCSYVINMKNLFHDKTYVATFNVKRQMLLDYPEVIYEKIEGTRNEDYRPDMRPECIRKDRLTINSSSAHFAAKCLCPYGRLSDIDTVSFLYPSREKAKELGISQKNILDETIEFIETRMKPRVCTKRGQEIIDSLYEMVEMYRSIEGKDFNTSHSEYNEVFDLSSFSKRVNVPYMDKDGDISECYVTFSVGGIHGAEYDKKQYIEDCATYENNRSLFCKIITKYKNALNVAYYSDEYGNKKKRKTIIIDEKEYQVSEFLKAGYTEKKAEFKNEYLNPQKAELFPEDADGLRKLNRRYVRTSFGLTNHEDFISYYSSLLINLGAFINEGLGYDRYEEIFQNKERHGSLMADNSLSEEKRILFANMREGTKLILNSASGTADVNYNNPIRMNNAIISMRIIGQLFTWRIGQAQSLEGAKVISTNTDGLYTMMDEEKNTVILEREANDIHVGIKTEQVYLVSKDANNRWEGILKGYTGNSLVDIEITNAAGGTLGCMNGPLTTKSLDHPAIIDWSLAEFLKWKVLQGKVDAFVERAGLRLIKEISPYFFPDKREYLRMFQNIISSSEKTGTYIFASKIPYSQKTEEEIKPIMLQHHNRVFYVDPQRVPQEYKEHIVYLAVAYIRQEQTDANLLAIYVIKDLYHDKESIISGTPKIKKINGIEFNTHCMIVNEELAYTVFDPSWLDYDYYNKLLHDKYTENWQNDYTGIEKEK